MAVTTRSVRDEVVARRRAERAVRRSTEIGDAVADLVLQGGVSHELVAARTGVPLGYLLWAYPDAASLAATAAHRNPTPRTPLSRGGQENPL